MGFYDNMVKTVQRLLTTKGRVMTLRHQNPGAYATSTGSSTISEVLDTGLRGALLKFKDQAAPARDRATLIQARDRRVLLSPVGVTSEPKPGDKVTIGADDWSVIDVSSINPAGTVVAYDLHVRR